MDIPTQSTSKNTAPDAVTTTPTKETALAGSSIANTKLSGEEKEKILAEAKKAQDLTNILKKVFILLLVITAGGFLWAKLSLDSENKMLSMFGMQENIGMKNKSLEKKEKKLKNEKKTIEGKIKKMNHQIETKAFSQFSEEIETLQNQQLRWFDTITPEGETNFGMVNALNRLESYFNSREYSDPQKIISGRRGQIKVKNVSVSRDGINASVETTQLFGKLFFLNVEFSKMVNAFPFFKNAEIRSFSRKKNKEEDDSMTISIKADIQLPDEEDSFDVFFIDYKNWIKK